MVLNCIRIWQKHDAPEEFKFYYDDVDFIAYVPGSFPEHLIDNLHLMANMIYTNQVEGGLVITGAHA